MKLTWESLTHSPSLSLFDPQTYDPSSVLLSAQVLLALGSGVDIPTQSPNFMSDIPVYFLPGSFTSIAAGCLQQQVLGPDVFSTVYDAFPVKGFSSWTLQWHLGIREAAAWELLQQYQQQQTQQGLAAAFPSEAAVAAAVQRAYASPDVR